MFRVVIRPLVLAFAVCLLATGCGSSEDKQPKAPPAAAKIQEKSAATGGQPKPRAE